jgi:small subunit ribosomal protein S2
MGSNMAPYIYMERNGIHIINLYKTAAKIEMKLWKKSLHQVKNIIRCYQKTNIVAEKTKAANMPYITERWPGGIITL